jgi:uncharacterized protein (TIGR02145 family)
MAVIDYNGGAIWSAIRNILNKISLIQTISGIISPTGFNKNLSGKNITNPQELANAVDQLVLGGGSGTVASVNSVQPNGNGNISLSKSDLGLGNVDNVSQDTHTYTFDGTHIPLAYLSGDLGIINVTSNLILQPDFTNSKNNYCTSVIFVGDGSHSIDLTNSGFIQQDNESFDNTKSNPIIFANMGRKAFYMFMTPFTGATQTTLSAPTVTGSVLSTTSLRFSWSNITNNSGYTYEISTDSGSTWGSPNNLAANTTSVDITGLTNGTRRDVRVLTIGDGVTYASSAYSTAANATTSSLTQLSTPTLNAPTVVSTTELDLSWSTVANVTSWKLEWSANGTTGWTQIGGTIASGTLSYNHTSLTANTVYYYRLTAVGDQVTYSNSNVSSNVNATTKNVAPTLVSSVTSTDGLTITHTFSRAMASSPTTTGYSTFPAKTISSATRNTDTTKIDVVVSVAFTSGDTITATIPTWAPADGGNNYAGVSGTSVTNNVTSSITDYDGNVYTSIVIGTQTWMVQNFKCTHLNDGTAISNITNNTTWLAATTPAWRYYNDNSSYGTTYGLLYNGYTASAANLAPAGWHVPTTAEFTTLYTYLGGISVAGGHLKESGTTHWLTPNTGGDNSSGFTLLPAGSWTPNSFSDLGDQGWLRSTTTPYYVANSSAVLNAYGSQPTWALSIRLIHD